MTPRLRGLPLAESDLADLVALHRDEPILAAFHAEPGDVPETRAFLERRLAQWREQGFGIWMFRDARGAFVGRCGIHRWSLDGRDEVEIGFIVRSDLWSQGFATEMGAAVIEHAFTGLALPDLVGFTLTDNARSQRVLEKLGFDYERTFVSRGEESVLYRLRNPRRRTPALEFPRHGASVGRSSQGEDRMTTLLAHHRVADYDAWKQVYDSVGEMQRSGGVRTHRVWHSEDDPNLVVVEHTFDSRDAAEAFVNSTELREAMGRAGVDESSLEVEYLEETASGTL